MVIARTSLVFVLAVVIGWCSVETAAASSGDEMALVPSDAADVRALPQQAIDAQAGVGNIHRHFPDPEALLERKAGLSRAGSSAPPSAPIGPLAIGSPTVSVGPSFVGLRQSESGGWYPPDTQVAAGPAHVVEAVNLQMRVFDKSGGVVSS